MNWSQLENKTELRKHQQSVENLSAYLDMPRDHIFAVYDQELIRMEQMARVRDYLPILVSRRVKSMLRS